MENKSLISSQRETYQSYSSYATGAVSKLYRGVVYTIAPYIPDLNTFNPLNFFKERNQTTSDSMPIETTDFSIFPPIPEGHVIHPNGMYVKSLHSYTHEAIANADLAETKPDSTVAAEDALQEKPVENEPIKLDEQPSSVQSEQVKKAAKKKKASRRRGKEKIPVQSTAKAVKPENEWHEVISKKAKAAAKQIKVAEQTKSSEKSVIKPVEAKAAGGTISLNMNSSIAGVNLALGIINKTSTDKKPAEAVAAAATMQEATAKEPIAPAILPKTPKQVFEGYFSDWVCKNKGIPARNYAKHDRLHHPPELLLKNLPNVIMHIEKSPYKGCAARVLIPCRFKLLNPNIISSVEDKGVLEIGLKENEPYHLFYAQANTDDKKARYRRLKGVAETNNNPAKKSEKKYGPYTKVNREHPVVEDEKHFHYLEAGYQWTVYKKRD